MFVLFFLLSFCPFEAWTSTSNQARRAWHATARIKSLRFKMPQQIFGDYLIINIFSLIYLENVFINESSWKLPCRIIEQILYLCLKYMNHILVSHKKKKILEFPLGYNEGFRILTFLLSSIFLPILIPHYNVNLSDLLKL